MSDIRATNEFEKIRCPNCGAAIAISEALQHQLTEQAEARVRAEVARREKALATREGHVKSRETAVEDAASQIEKRVQERLGPEQASLKAREVAVAAAETVIDARVRERLATERAALEESLRSLARAEVAVELTDLRASRLDIEKRLKDSQQAELQLRRERRDLEAQKNILELGVARRVDAERTAIREQAIKDTVEEHRLKDAEKDRKLQDVLRLNDELRRKVQQGSQQTQGEVLESALEELLKAHFPLDKIEPVAKGTHGADVLQRVYTRSGHYCGAIVWESKNTKHWTDGWIEKLKDDQREAKADLAVLVSAVLPKEMSGCGVCEGVWVADARVAIGLATALRNGLIELAVTRCAVAGKNETVEVLFAYLTGPEFRQQVEVIVRTFADMQADLEEEKRVFARRWGKRGKQIARVIESTAGMYGDLQGLLGSSLAPIAALDQGEEAVADAIGGEAVAGDTTARNHP
jgi:hypothetical protein